jgi:hypothetical protein
VYAARGGECSGREIAIRDGMTVGVNALRDAVFIELRLDCTSPHERLVFEVKSTVYAEDLPNVVGEMEEAVHLE